MAKKVKVSELVEHFQLEVISGQEGLKRLITVDDLNRPGLEMAGYFEYYPEDRVQLMGKTGWPSSQCFLPRNGSAGFAAFATIRPLYRYYTRSGCAAGTA